MKTIKAFVRSNRGHTQKGLAHTLLVIEHMLEHRDWDAAATLISGCDPKMGKRIRDLIGVCVGGVTMAKDAKHPTGMRFKLGDNFGPTEHTNELRAAVLAELSIYSDEVTKKVLERDVKEPTPKSVDDVEKHVKQYLAKHGFELVGDYRVVAELAMAA